MLRAWNWIDSRVERAFDALGETGQMVVFLTALCAAVWFGIPIVGSMLVDKQCVGHDRGMGKTDHWYVWLGSQECPK